jgi:hypothetical protein
MSLLKLDHLAVSCTNLTLGAGQIAKTLGVTLDTGGEHPDMGTHNRLMSLGAEVYFEVIAINPEATAPNRPRWFDIDNFQGPPRLTNWILQTPDMDAALDALPDGFGTPMTLQRGNLRWKMAVPDTGILPWGGWAPAIIEWLDGGHPAPGLPDVGVRLEALRLKHPYAEQIAHVLAPLLPRDTILFQISDTPGLTAIFDTPNGQVTLT